ncbi:MAG: hypothetical protein RIR26_2439 [Pseudomonadota bacterium]
METHVENYWKCSFDEALSSLDTLSLLIPRVRVFHSGLKDKKKAKAVEELLVVLEELERLLVYVDQLKAESSAAADLLFIDGIPRTSFQVEIQLSRFANPKSPWQKKWTQLRWNVWQVFEKTIPWNVRELLMSWRWSAELQSFRKINQALAESRTLVSDVDQRLLSELKLTGDRSLRVTWSDRWKILRWSRAAKKDEADLVALEQLRDAFLSRIAEEVAECERIAAQFSIQLRTLFADCGELHSKVFQNSCRAIDKEIRANLESEYQQANEQNSEFMFQYEEKSRSSLLEVKKITDRKNRLTKTVDGQTDANIEAAEKLIFQEFMVLNSLEMEKQDDARQRWTKAVGQMKRLLQTAEESFSHVESNSGDFDGSSAGRTAAAQIRM